jgi:tripartite ATP-independent transporter DctM subunit
MDWQLVVLLAYGSLALLLAMGLPVAFSFLAVNLAGAILFFGGWAGLQQLVFSIKASVSTFVLAPVALFVLMGELIAQAGIMSRVINVVDEWMWRIPGRLGLVTVGAASIFATLSGSQIASAAMLTRTIGPDMRRHGYSKTMTLGPILGAGGLATMIPPSGMAIVIGCIASISVGKLLIGGAIPGLLMATFYASYIIIRCKLNPSLAPSYVSTRATLSQKLVSFVWYVLPLGSIVFLVIGLIFLGVATPTEAASLGCAGAIILTAMYGKLSLKALIAAGYASLRTTGMVLMIFTGSKAFSQLLAYTGGTSGILRMVQGLPISPIYTVMLMLGFLVLLGTFLDAMSILMVSIPIYMPIVNSLGLDVLWFGIMVLLCTEIGNASPPFGMMLFAVKAASPPDITIEDIYRATIPFVLCDLVVLVLLLYFPEIGVWLPSLMDVMH